MDGQPIYFAIGDVHGERARLEEMHRAILGRIAFEKLPARIVHLGDYVDRGPDSRGVIDTVIGLQKRYHQDPLVKVLALMGNHEEMMLSQIGGAGPHWLGQGGTETLASYGIDAREHADDWADLVPREHLVWLMKLPTLHHDPHRKLAFVHAGVDPRRFPDCSDTIRLWTRNRSFTDFEQWPRRRELDGLTVVHGHTPTPEPEVHPHRINVDTGAVYGGALTCVVLKDGEKPQFLRT